MTTQTPKAAAGRVKADEPAPVLLTEQARRVEALKIASSITESKHPVDLLTVARYIEDGITTQVVELPEPLDDGPPLTWAPDQFVTTDQEGTSA